MIYVQLQISYFVFFNRSNFYSLRKLCSVWERERDRKREGETETDRQRQRERQTQRHIQTDRDERREMKVAKITA